MLGHVVAFLATADPEPCRTFYSDVLGLPLLEESERAMVFDIRGTQLRIQKVEHVMAPPYTAFGMRVPDLDSVMDDLRDRGVAFEFFDGLPQDEQGVWTTPDGARVAWFRDPDGHVLSLACPS